MTTTRPAAAFAETLVRVSRLVQYVFSDVARQNDLTPQQTQLLCALRHGPVGMRELGRLLHLEKSSLTGLIDRVERRGLVTRSRDAQDRRAVRIALTGDGARLGLQSHDELTGRLEILAGQIVEAEVDLVTAILGQIVGEQDQEAAAAAA